MVGKNEETKNSKGATSDEAYGMYLYQIFGHNRKSNGR